MIVRCIIDITVPIHTEGAHTFIVAFHDSHNRSKHRHQPLSHNQVTAKANRHVH
jgi:hypothetical protein